MGKIPIIQTSSKLLFPPFRVLAYSTGKAISQTFIKSKAMTIRSSETSCLPKLALPPILVLVPAVMSLCLAAGAVNIARATLIAWDDFNLVNKDIPETANDYISNNNLYGQSASTGSYGFTGTWSGANSNFFVLSEVGYKLGGTGANILSGVIRMNAGGSGNTRTASRSFTASSGQNTLWFSSLVRIGADGVTSENNTEGLFGLTSGRGSIVSSDGTQNASWSDSNGKTLSGFQLGLSGGNTLSVKYQSDASGTGSITTADTGFVLETANQMAYFLVARLDVNTSGNDDTLKIWALTSIPANEEAILALTPTCSITADILKNSGELDTLLLTSTSNANIYALAYLDALRVGTTYGDLLLTEPPSPSIPEPSSTAALAAGAGILLTVLIRNQGSSGKSFLNRRKQR
jgi:hypothetical protein